jgi:hypothetical protein
VSTESRPNRDRIATESRPNRDRTEYFGFGVDRIATESRPNRDRIATESRPNLRFFLATYLNFITQPISKKLVWCSVISSDLVKQRKVE